MYETMKLTDVTLYTRKRVDNDTQNPFEWDIKRVSDLFGGKRILLIGLPGAFTPTCSNSQLPGFENIYDDLIAKGIDEVYCTSVNDAFVMFQWAKSLGIEKVKMLPDGNGDFASYAGMLVDKSNLGFGMRSWRYAAIIDDLIVQKVFSEKEQMANCPNDPYEMSSPEKVMKWLN